jgi:hypothetical protein
MDRSPLLSVVHWTAAEVVLLTAAPLQFVVLKYVRLMTFWAHVAMRLVLSLCCTHSPMATLDTVTHSVPLQFEFGHEISTTAPGDFTGGGRFFTRSR